MTSTEAGQGLFASLRQLLATGLDALKLRLELLSVEIEQEKLRLFSVILWTVFALMLLGIGLVMLCILMILLLWESHRLVAVGGLAACFVAGGLMVLRSALVQLRTNGGLFSASVAELAQDRHELEKSG